jgi:hypothetical protein
MGMYINPPNRPKEGWLIEMLTKNYAREVKPDEFFQMTWESIPEKMKVLVLLDNGSFTALAVAYNKSEFNYFQQQLKTDTRKTWIVLCQEDKAMEFAK